MVELHEFIHSEKTDEWSKGHVQKFLSKAQILRWFKRGPFSSEFVYELNKNNETIIMFQGKKRRLVIVGIQ